MSELFRRCPICKGVTTKQGYWNHLRMHLYNRPAVAIIKQIRKGYSIKELEKIVKAIKLLEKHFGEDYGRTKLPYRIKRSRNNWVDNRKRTDPQKSDRRL